MFATEGSSGNGAAERVGSHRTRLPDHGCRSDVWCAVREPPTHAGPERVVGNAELARIRKKSSIPKRLRDRTAPVLKIAPAPSPGRALATRSDCAQDMWSGGTARMTSTFTGRPSCRAGRNSQYERY